eukprot:4652654-Pyramimonas_sp.AAC.1
MARGWRPPVWRRTARGGPLRTAPPTTAEHGLPLRIFRCVSGPSSGHARSSEPSEPRCSTL